MQDTVERKKKRSNGCPDHQQHERKGDDTEQTNREAARIVAAIHGLAKHKSRKKAHDELSVNLASSFKRVPFLVGLLQIACNAIQPLFFHKFLGGGFARNNTLGAGSKGYPFCNEKSAMKQHCETIPACYDEDMDTSKPRRGRKIGYVRVSDKDQTEALQVDALKAAGCDLIYGDHGVSGAISKRRGLDEVLSALEDGDTLVVWKLDRLGRSTIHLLQLLSDLRDRGVDFQAITQGIDTTTAVGRMLYGQLAVFAEYERTLISERTKAGMAAAKARGVHVGRPRLSKTMDNALDKLEKHEVH